MPEWWGARQEVNKITPRPSWERGGGGGDQVISKGVEEQYHKGGGKGREWETHRIDLLAVARGEFHPWST